MKIKVYTDGACNREYGSWAYLLIAEKDDASKIYRTFREATENMTNQKAELRAVLAAMNSFTRPTKFTIYTDSAYIVNCFLEGWYVKWEVTGWRNSHGQPVANQDLWRPILAKYKEHAVDFVKVKGHSGNPFNEYVDSLAKLAMIELDNAYEGDYSGVSQHGKTLVLSEEELQVRLKLLSK